MDNQDRPKSEDQQSTEDLKTEEVIKIHNPKITIQNDAGPSKQNDLPGSVPSTIIVEHKYGISQSEHNLRHVFTTKDVANALKICSLGFSPVSASVKNLDLIKLKVPESLENKTELVDLKSLMATCFKLENEGPVKLKEVVPAVRQQAIKAERTEECVNLTSVVHAQTETPGALEGVPKDKESLDSKTSKGSKKKGSENISAKSEQSAFQRDSLSSIGSNVCRICMTRGRERLISPCYCKGSLANVHLSCLERWLNQVGRNHCELCGYSYPAIRTPRYTVLQALRLWFGNPRNRSHLQIISLQSDLSRGIILMPGDKSESDCLIFWLLSTVTAGLLAVCIVGTQYFVVEGSKFNKINSPGGVRNEGISHRITETAMDFFMAVVLCGYSVTVYLLWKDHYVMWNRWRRANVNVRLLISNDTSPVPFVPAPRYNVV